MPEISQIPVVLVLSFLLSSSLVQADTTINPTIQAQTTKTPSTNSINEVRTIDWIDLLPTNVDRKALMEHYADLVIQRLDPPDDLSLQEKIVTELQQAPVNKALAGVRIRLAGYMIVLDEFEGKIAEFLLVPYSGAGVYQPAPPANQMLLVQVKPEHALSTEQTYESVWVEGYLKIQPEETSIAQVSYLLEDAQIRLYTADDAKQAEAQETEHEHEANQAHQE